MPHFVTTHRNACTHWHVPTPMARRLTEAACRPERGCENSAIVALGWCGVGRTRQESAMRRTTANKGEQGRMTASTLFSVFQIRAPYHSRSEATMFLDSRRGCGRRSNLMLVGRAPSRSRREATRSVGILALDCELDLHTQLFRRAETHRFCFGRVRYAGGGQVGLATGDAKHMYLLIFRAYRCLHPGRGVLLGCVLSSEIFGVPKKSCWVGVGLKPAPLKCAYRKIRGNVNDCWVCQSTACLLSRCNPGVHVCGCQRFGRSSNRWRP